MLVKLTLGHGTRRVAGALVSISGGEGRECCSYAVGVSDEFPGSKVMLLCGCCVAHGTSFELPRRPCLQQVVAASRSSRRRAPKNGVEKVLEEGAWGYLKVLLFGVFGTREKVKKVIIFNSLFSSL